MLLLLHSEDILAPHLHGWTMAGYFDRLMDGQAHSLACWEQEFISNYATEQIFKIARNTEMLDIDFNSDIFFNSHLHCCVGKGVNLVQ